MAIKYNGENVLSYLLTLLKGKFDTKVDKVSGKALSTNDLTDALKGNYDTAYTHSQSAHAPSDAEKNTLVGIQKNGTDVTIDTTTRKANIIVPTKTSDITNDSGFITTSDIPEGAAASTTVPKMNGTAAVGTETAFARGDHVHPSDTTKVDKVDGKGLSTNDYTSEEKAKLSGIAANANNYTLPAATASVLGGVTIGSNVSVSSGKISVADASTSAKGVVQLSSSTSGTSTTKAATESAVKAAYDLASSKQSPATSLSGYGIEDAYTKTEIDSKISSVYKPAGSVAFASLPTPAAGVLGNVYNVTDAFTTTASFIEGAGSKYPTGTNVVVVQSGTGYKFDVLAGFVDLSAYALSDDYVELTNEEVQILWNTVFAS